MASKKKGPRSQPHDKGSCVVCFHPSKIFSIGECDHPVCYSCSTRMRVICGRTECPICRKDLGLVVFARKVDLFSNILNKTLKCERRYKIYFYEDDIMDEYDDLLKHICSMCDDNFEFKNFSALDEHMRKEHERFFCDLCVRNLKVFTHERRCYTRMQLGQHRRIGDADDKSHKGHPLCEFCDCRFMDSDDLYRHLRIDHFFCHFCDADGMQKYYDTYDTLRVHFKNDHFLCEEGNCKDEKFTSAYRTAIDFQAHLLKVHKSKVDSRQARNVAIGFVMDQEEGRQRGDYRSRRRANQEREAEIAAAAAAFVPAPSVDITCGKAFPLLLGKKGKKDNSAAIPAATVDAETPTEIQRPAASEVLSRSKYKKGNHATIEEEYPSLVAPTFTAPVATPSSVPPAASFHVSLNTKGRSNGAAASKVSIEYSHTTAFSPSSDDEAVDVTHASAIWAPTDGGRTQKTKSSNVPRMSDFPALGMPQNTAQAMFPTTTTSKPQKHAVVQPQKHAVVQPQKHAVAQPPKSKPQQQQQHHQHQQQAPPSHPQPQAQVQIKAKASSAKSSKVVLKEEDFPSLGFHSAPIMPIVSQVSKITKPTLQSQTEPLWATSQKSSSKEQPSFYNDNNLELTPSFSLSIDGLYASTRNNKAKINKNIESSKSSAKNKSKGFTLADAQNFPSLGAGLGPSIMSSTKNGPTSLTRISRQPPKKEKELQPTSADKTNKIAVSAKEVKNEKNSAIKISKAEIPSKETKTLAKETKTVTKVPEIREPLRKQRAYYKYDDYDSDEDAPKLDFSRGKLGEYESLAPKITPKLSVITLDTQPAQKKSQLKIGRLATPNLAADFPALGQPISTFNNNSNPKSNTKTVNSVKESKKQKSASVISNGHATDMTFTSSLGSQFSISPPNNASQPPSPSEKKAYGEFSLPPQFDQRNKALISAVTNACAGDGNKFNRFKELASALRCGSMPARDYYDQCRVVMGKGLFHSVLPELLVLLPDIGKQKSVLNAYRRFDGGRGCSVSFSECDRCGQVVVPKDLKAHNATHSSSDAKKSGRK